MCSCTWSHYCWLYCMRNPTGCQYVLSSPLAVYYYSLILLRKDPVDDAFCIAMGLNAAVNVVSDYYFDLTE